MTSVQAANLLNVSKMTILNQYKKHFPEKVIPNKRIDVTDEELDILKGCLNNTISKLQTFYDKKYNKYGGIKEYCSYLSEKGYNIYQIEQMILDDE